MRSAAKLFLTTAIIEVGVGLSLLCLPTQVIWLLLGVKASAPETLVLGKIAGAALLALGAACWVVRKESGSEGQRALGWGLFIYNFAAFVVLALAGMSMRMSGVALWPAVVLHLALTIWCAAYLHTATVPE